MPIILNQLISNLRPMKKVLCIKHIASRHATILAALFVFAAGALKAQEEQLWTNLSISAPIENGFTVGGDVDWRGLISERNWNQILIRPTASYKFERLGKVAAGFALFSTINQDDYNVNEFRLHQDFNVTWPNFGWSRLFYRLRFEERWFFYEELPNSFSFRARIMAGIHTKDITTFSEKRPIYGKFSLEGFIPFERGTANEVFINNFRTDLGFGHRILPHFRYELHYIAQLSKLFVSDGTQEVQHIFRLRMFYTIDPPAQPDEIVNPDGD